MKEKALRSVAEILEDQKFSTKKVAKKNKSTKVHMSISTDVKGSTDDSEVNGINDTDVNRGDEQAESLRFKRKDVEIDQYLFSLLKEGLIANEWKSWHAKAIYTLGWERYNMIVLDIREAISRGKEQRGKPVTNPIGLFSYKVKGTLQLHARTKFYDEGRSFDNESAAPLL